VVEETAIISLCSIN